MTPEREERLFATYPELYADRAAPLSVSLMAYGFDCSDGWYDLIDELSRALTQVLLQQPKAAVHH